MVKRASIAELESFHEDELFRCLPEEGLDDFGEVEELPLRKPNRKVSIRTKRKKSLTAETPLPPKKVSIGIKARTKTL